MKRSGSIIFLNVRSICCLFKSQFACHFHDILKPLYSSCAQRVVSLNRLWVVSANEASKTIVSQSKLLCNRLKALSTCFIYPRPRNFTLLYSERLHLFVRDVITCANILKFCELPRILLICFKKWSWLCIIKTNINQ